MHVFDTVHTNPSANTMCLYFIPLFIFFLRDRVSEAGGPPADPAGAVLTEPVSTNFGAKPSGENSGQFVSTEALPKVGFMTIQKRARR